MSEELVILQQSEERQKLELNGFLNKIEIIKDLQHYPRVEREMREVREGLTNRAEEYISPNELVYDPIRSIQVLREDYNSPFGSKRNLICNFWRFQDHRRKYEISTEHTPEVYRDQLPVSNDQIRITNLHQFYEECNHWADKGKFVTYTSGDANFSSIMNPSTCSSN